MSGWDGGAAAMRKNEEAADALLGKAWRGGASSSRFGSFCAEVRMARRGCDPGEATACSMALNLLARFLAHVQYMGPSEPLRYLHRSQRRRIERNGCRRANVSLVIGDEKPAPGSEAIYVGSSGWSSYLSTEGPCAWGPDPSGNAMGAMMSGALAVGEVFKRLFPDAGPEIVPHMEYDLATHGAAKRQPVLAPRVPPVVGLDRTALVGCGAIGQAICFALAQFPLSGHVTLIDHDKVDASNLQRYVLASEEEVGAPKAGLLGNYLAQSSPLLGCHAVPATFEAFADHYGSRIKYDAVVVCVDNVATRVNVQGMLPRVVWNGWTDISRHSLRYGASRHVIGGKCACIGCYYYPEGPEPTAEDMGAAMTGLPAPRIRRLLNYGAVCTPDLAREVSEKSGVALDKLERNVGKPFREILHGRCGVFALKTGEGAVTAPAPHQPMLAGLLVASQLILSKCRAPQGETLRIKSASSFDAMRVPRPGCLFKVAKVRRCFCADKDYVDTYRAKWPRGPKGAGGRAAGVGIKGRRGRTAGGGGRTGRRGVTKMPAVVQHGAVASPHASPPRRRGPSDPAVTCAKGWG